MLQQGGAAGLTTADVERVVEDKARWILDYEKDMEPLFQTVDVPLIPLLDLIIAFPTRY